ncbi:MAG: extracellular solute-binding protein [Lachnospiraceae bacterium]|jgi:ABC-type glycerol-3-phosphate transport system substrate-binding protein|nr:extracellular solute-binding protein [Lachnospiraceae bacterium]
MNLDGTDIKELGEPAFDAGEYISYIIAGKDGKLSLLTSRWGSEEEGQTCYIASLDDSFNVTDHIDITKELGLSNETYIAKALADDKGNLVVITNDSAIVLDKDLKKVGELKSDNNYIEAAAKTKDGQIICASSGEEGAIVQVADLDAKKFGEKFKLDGMNYFSSSDAVMDGYGKYDFFYKDESGIYGYSISDKKGTKVLDYLASEIDSNRTYGIVPMGEETFIGQSWEETGSILTKYTKVDPSQVKDKETIVFASLWSVDDTIRSAAIKFNKESDKYRITFKDYNDEEDPVSKMNADIIAGNVADIMDVSYMPVGQYVAKGILEDLTPYYDKDEEVSKDDIIPSVEKAMEIDGKLYYVAPSFSINTVIASKKDVGDKTGWTFDELKALLEEKGDDVRPFYSENKVDILSSFLYSNLNDYIDWTTGECRFSSDDFKSILEIANRGTNEEMDYSEDMPSEPSLIKSGKVLLTAGWMDTDYIQTYSKMYNSDISLIGYPCEDKNGSYFSFDSRLGIYSKSNYKDGAWEFIKTLMTKDYQATGGHIWNNPTNKDAFECYMKTKTATEKYTDEYGVEVEPNESSWGWEDLEIKIGPLSKEEEQMYRDLINNTTKVTESNDAIMEIINEEAKNYFSGQKSLDETADIIQNRLTTYVNENR